MEVRVLKRGIRLFDPSIHVMVPVFGCGPQWLKDSPVVWLMGPLVHGVLESPFCWCHAPAAIMRLPFALQWIWRIWG